MRRKELGKTGVMVPEIGLGTWAYHGGAELLQRGLEAGARFIDTAESYGTEPVVGEAIAGRREQVFLATKVSPQNFRKADVISAAEKSLRRLRTDYIDLYQLHEPNPAIPLEETLDAMEELVNAGKVRFIGVSNFSLAQLQHARRVVRKHPIVANQIRFNLIDRPNPPELLAYCAREGISIIAYCPLGRGLHHIRDCDPKGVLDAVAKSTGKSAAQVALNWCLGHDRVVAIPKANSAAHLLENCEASDWRLSEEDFDRLSKAIVYRRRGAVDALIRRCLPSGLKQRVKGLGRLLPPALRRRLN